MLLHVYFTLFKKMRTLNDNLATLKNKEASSLEIESVKSKIKSTAKALTFF